MYGTGGDPVSQSVSAQKIRCSADMGTNAEPPLNEREREGKGETDLGFFGPRGIELYNPLTGPTDQNVLCAFLYRHCSRFLAYGPGSKKIIS